MRCLSTGLQHEATTRRFWSSSDLPMSDRLQLGVRYVSAAEDPKTVNVLQQERCPVALRHVDVEEIGAVHVNELEHRSRVGRHRGHLYIAERDVARMANEEPLRGQVAEHRRL